MIPAVSNAAVWSALQIHDGLCGQFGASPLTTPSAISAIATTS
jgi:hypothetical protein